MTIKSLPIFSFLFATLFFTLVNGATFQITNKCGYTVWAAAIPGGGRRLNMEETWTITINPGTTGGRVWARTGCQFDGTGRGKCQTGDCNGQLVCQSYGVAPNTLAEYAIDAFDNLDFIDMSLIEGFNVPMEFSSASGNCSRAIQCTADIIGQCPDELKVPGGCNGPCTVFKTEEHCCNSGSSNCDATNYSRYFKDRCPDAYSYPKDDATSTFTCPTGTNYKVIFCPKANPKAKVMCPNAFSYGNRLVILRNDIVYHSETGNMTVIG